MSALDHENRPATDVPRHRWFRFGFQCAAGGLVAAAGSVLAAGWLPIGDMTPWAQLVAFRPQLGVGLLVLAGAMGLLVRAVRTLCLVLAVLAATSTVTLLGRVDGTVIAADDSAVTVLSSNVMADGASVDEIVELAVTSRVDAVVLPEASRWFAASVTEGARRRGLALVSQTDEPLDPVDGMVTSDHVATGPFPTSVLVRTDLKPRFATALPGALLGSLIATVDVGGRQLNLVAVHPAPPLPGQVSRWRADLGTVARWCATPSIIAGDFNATLDHPPFERLLDSGCVDAAALSGNALTGTWPSSWPRLLAAPLDHVLLAGQRRTVTSFAVHDITGSDHRALLATVTP
ncbi:MAG: endonuclease/exonuclease/phosphatase family protein [Pseudonocardiaceae bacterium]